MKAVTLDFAVAFLALEHGLRMALAGVPGRSGRGLGPSTLCTAVAAALMYCCYRDCCTIKFLAAIHGGTATAPGSPARPSVAGRSLRLRGSAAQSMPQFTPASRGWSGRAEASFPASSPATGRAGPALP